MSSKGSVEREALFGILPVMRGERQFGLKDFILVNIGFGIAAWSFLIGGYTGSVLPAGTAVAVILFGNAIPVLLICGLAKFFARYGVDTFIGARASLGYQGSNIFLVIFAIINLGWMTMASFMLGESATLLVGAFDGPDWLTSRTVGAPIFAVGAFLVAWLIAYRGPVAIKLFNSVGVPTMFLIIVGLIVYILGVEGLGAALAAEPAAPYPDYTRSLVSAIEWNVGLGFSWVAYFGQWSRLANTERTAVWGSFLGWGVLLNVAAILGALTALLVGQHDPAKWMIAAGGPVFGVFGLLLLVLANLTSATILVYSQGISMKTMFPNWSWRAAIATTLPAMLLMLTPAFYDRYTTFLSYISFIMAAFGAVLVVDLVVMKRYRVDLASLYRKPAGGSVNWAAYASVVGGGLFYFWTYNPVADTAGPLFTYITAGIPTFFLTGAVYWGLKKLMGAETAPAADIAPVRE